MFYNRFHQSRGFIRVNVIGRIACHQSRERIYHSKCHRTHFCHQNREVIYIYIYKDAVAIINPQTMDLSEPMSHDGFPLINKHLQISGFWKNIDYQSDLKDCNKVCHEHSYEQSIFSSSWDYAPTWNLHSADGSDCGIKEAVYKTPR